MSLTEIMIKILFTSIILSVAFFLLDLTIETNKYVLNFKYYTLGKIFNILAGIFTFLSLASVLVLLWSL
jgi:hypothetical protein